ncbi:MAG: Substrate-binding region of ABC-type glycine betaine transport system [Chthonomonadaceae bacterium]|nr:Substrate-binding region of ABC-type glycine betaine transport system [Chthonomonadaceae bacterium]
MKRAFLLFPLLLILASLAANAQTIVIGSKKFPESNVLGKIAKRTLEKAGFTVEHKEDLGSTGIVWGALKGGSIAVYPEYTATISQEILKVKGEMTQDALRAALQKEGIGLGGDLGFNDNYGLVMLKSRADALNIHKISDLASHPDLKVGVSHEFLGRQDGWQPLAAKYGLHMANVSGIDHGLAYLALKSGQIDLTEAYTTDAEIAEYKLLVLEDDRSYFPKYHAVFVYRLDMPKKAVDALKTLEGTISEDKMIAMNAEAKKTKDYNKAAALYFAGSPGGAAGALESSSAASTILTLIGQHLTLVGISLALAILVGVPLGIVASRPGGVSQTILGIVGIIQTIPSLALLALLVPIPFFGISWKTAIAALFLYSLLPIVRNTATGLQEIPASLRESAAALGLEPGAQLRKIYLPIASRTILAGIKTSAVINVGTATLAALIGAGGLGQPIIRGISLNDNATILQGAVPAALLALAVEFGFNLIDRLLIPMGLRLPTPKN